MKKLFILFLVAFIATASACSSYLDEFSAEVDKNERRKKPAKTCIDPKRINPDIMCPMVYDPVCGCDGKTYGNACIASAAGVKSWVKGECAVVGKECKGEPNPAMICPAQYDPVCGCDDVTYSNACNAEAMGVKTYVKGACDSKKKK